MQNAVFNFAEKTTPERTGGHSRNQTPKLTNMQNEAFRFGEKIAPERTAGRPETKRHKTLYFVFLEGVGGGK